MATKLHTWVDEEIVTATKLNNNISTPLQVPTGESVYDTGWIAMSYPSGSFTSGTAGQLAYRRIGMVVYLRGGAEYGSYSAGNHTTIGTLPTACRPAQNHKVGTFGTGSRACVVQVYTDGTIRVAPCNGVSGVGWISASTSFALE